MALASPLLGMSLSGEMESALQALILCTKRSARSCIMRRCRDAADIARLYPTPASSIQCRVRADLRVGSLLRHLFPDFHVGSVEFALLESATHHYWGLTMQLMLDGVLHGRTRFKIGVAGG